MYAYIRKWILNNLRHYVGYFIFLRHTNFSFETCKFSIPFSPKIIKKKDNQKKWWRNSISTLQYADCEIKTNKKFNILRVRQHFVSTAIVRAHLITARLRDIATHATLNDISANIYIDIFKCEIEMRINIGIFWISAATTCYTFIYVWYTYLCPDRYSNQQHERSGWRTDDLLGWLVARLVAGMLVSW